MDLGLLKEEKMPDGLAKYKEEQEAKKDGKKEKSEDEESEEDKDSKLKNPEKADLDKDGKVSDYEEKRGEAVEKNMSESRIMKIIKNEIRKQLKERK